MHEAPRGFFRNTLQRDHSPLSCHWLHQGIIDISTINLLELPVSRNRNSNADPRGSAFVSVRNQRWMLMIPRIRSYCHSSHFCPGTPSREKSSNHIRVRMNFPHTSQHVVRCISCSFIRAGPFALPLFLSAPRFQLIGFINISKASSTVSASSFLGGNSLSFMISIVNSTPCNLHIQNGDSLPVLHLVLNLNTHRILSNQKVWRRRGIAGKLSKNCQLEA